MKYIILINKPFSVYFKVSKYLRVLKLITSDNLPVSQRSDIPPSQVNKMASFREMYDHRRLQAHVSRKSKRLIHESVTRCVTRH